jgi:16S rRNA (cytosine967-C5)-methyltransferase
VKSKIDFLVGHICELAEEMFLRTTAIDETAAKFFKSRHYLGSHDRAFIAEHVYGIVRYRRTIENALEQIFPSFFFLGQQKYFLYFVTLVVFQQKEKTDELLAEQLSLRWSQVQPAIAPENFLQLLRSFFSKQFLAVASKKNCGIQYSFPDLFVQKIAAANDEEQTSQLLSALNLPAPVTLRVNTLQCTREQCRTALHMEGIPTEETLYSPFGLKAKKRFNSQALVAYKRGWFEMQDEGSQLLALLLNGKENETVIDACAGAGGKSLAIAALMKNCGRIIALDIDAVRMRALHKRAQRAGITIVQSYLLPALEKEIFFESADAVLIDAPCTGSGTIRRNPMLKWKITDELIAEKVMVQKQLLEEYAQFVKPGGRVMYATCSLFQDENENVVESFLALRKNFRLVAPAEMFLPYALPQAAHKQFFTLLPHIHNTDGFFAAVFTRDY